MAAETKKQNPIEKLLASIDAFQQKRRLAGFPYAVVKKYGDDQMGHQAALVTYYGFLSLFPLLIVATSVVDLIAQHNTHLQASLLKNIDKYFPIGGDQLRSSVHGNSKSGVALVVGVLVTLYGARGIADAIRGLLDHAWATPRAKRTGFPKNTLKSLALLIGAGLGLLATTALSGFAAAAVGHAWYLRVVPIVINLGLLYLIFMYIYLIGTSRKFPRKDLQLGAIAAAVGLLIIQYAGIGLAKHELQNLQGLYGSFALVLTILFWIYLQAQIVAYAIEVNVVHAYTLWPRSLSGELTEADRKAYELYVKKEAMRPTPEEEIAVTFRNKDA